MTFEPGSRVGPYEIVGPLGAGGMGEVYRAKDARLNREVAVKTLPPQFAADAERVARFTREAQLHAALNHPHIAGIYGLEHAGESTCLVLELVEGSSLSAHLASGRLPVAESLRVARQIADALQAAHDKGIIHRDLKPGNVMLTPDGEVKVIDFGLAKAVEPAADTSPANSPTMTLGATQAGILLGTAAYMSPEQAKAIAADKRSDVWAFGCVVFEMLAGARAFEGADVSDTLASVLKSDPDWSRLPAGVPPAVRALVEGCLQKQRSARIADISTVLFVLDRHAALAPASGADAYAPPTRANRPWRRALPVAGAALAGATIAAAVLWRAPAAAPQAPTRFTIPLPEVQTYSVSQRLVAISADGTKVSYAAGGQIFVRSLADDFSAEAVPGTDTRGGGMSPVFSLDGRRLAFWSSGDRELKQIGIEGGAAVTLTDTVSNIYGIRWDEHGLVIGSGADGVVRVTEAGAAETIVKLESGEAASAAQILPGGRYVLLTLGTGQITGQEVFGESSAVVLYDLQTGTRRTLVEDASDGRLLPTGHLVYAVGGTLFAAPFDSSAMAVGGPAEPVIEGVRRGISGVVHFATSETGVLAYVPGPVSTSARRAAGLALADRTGKVESLPLRPDAYDFPRASPDGTSVAFTLAQAGQNSVWVYGLSGTSSRRRLTLAGESRHPVWSPDSRRIVFQSDREGDLGLFVQRADGTGAVERLTKPGAGVAHVPAAWSPDGGHLLFDEQTKELTTLQVLSLGDGTITPFGGVTSRNPTGAAFSPDGRWVVYSSRVEREHFVYVRPFPATAEVHQISKEGENAHHPAWSPDGRELFYVPQVGRLVVVSVQTRPGFSFSDPVPVPRRFAVSSPATQRPWDVAPDGRILSVFDEGQMMEAEIRVVLNWFDELRAKVPLR